MINNGKIDLVKVIYWIVLERYLDLNNKRVNIELHIKLDNLILRVKNTFCMVPKNIYLCILTFTIHKILTNVIKYFLHCLQGHLKFSF